MPPHPDYATSKRTVVQCHGHAKSGERCKRRTARSPYCFTHLEKEEHLKIKTSTIPHSGLGIFTTTARKKNDNVARYSEKSYVNYDDDHGGDYVLEVKANPPTYVNPYRTTDSSGRYSNTARNRAQGTNNAKISYNPRSKKASIKATANIPADREIKTSYGRNAHRDYW